MIILFCIYVLHTNTMPCLNHRSLYTLLTAYHTYTDPNATEIDAITKADYKSVHVADVNSRIQTDSRDKSNEIMSSRSQKVNMTFSYDCAFSATTHRPPKISLQNPNPTSPPSYTTTLSSLVLRTKS